MESFSIEEICKDDFLIDWIEVYENNNFVEVEKTFADYLYGQGQSFTLGEAFDLLDLYKQEVTARILDSIASSGSLVGLEFYKAAEDEKSSPRICLILNDKDYGVLKLTFYDVYGPVSHEYHAEVSEKILSELLMQGFNSIRPGALDAFTDLPTWKVC